MKKGFFTAVITVVFYSAAFAAGEPMAFLKLGAGARAASMGGAYTAQAADGAAMFYNPASAASFGRIVMESDVFFMSFGRHVNFVSLASPFDLGGVRYGAGLSWFNYSAGSDIEIRSTNSPSPERLVSDSSHLFYITASAALSPVFNAGINAKFDLRLVDDVRAFGFGFDAGILLKINDNISAGISAKNLGANTGWEKRNYLERPPQIYTAGISYDTGRLSWPEGSSAVLSADFEAITFGEFKLRLGAEARINRNFSVRAGFDGSPVFGCGALFDISSRMLARFDYAFSFDAVVEGAVNHRAGLALEFDMPSQAAAQKQEHDNEERPW